MKDLAAALSGLPSVRRPAPWSGFEHVKGWGVFGLPFDSGHVLALRVFPENDFDPYRSLWHRDPEGRWSIFVDGPQLDTACPRYFGTAADDVRFARIEVSWTGPASLRVRVDNPSLTWDVTAGETRSLRFINLLSPRMPLWTWRPRFMIRGRELMARRLGLGDIKLAGRMPSGHEGLLMPAEMYFVTSSFALLRGENLGLPIRVAANPTIGGVPLPSRGVLAIGRGMWKADNVAAQRPQ